MNALYRVDYKQLQLRPHQSHEGTCEWLYRDTIFQSWSSFKASAILWLSGQAGVGKSVLTRRLVEDTLAGSPSLPLPNELLVASYFCSYNEASVNSEETVLRSLLHQVVQVNPLCRNVVSLQLQKRTLRVLEYDLSLNKLWTAFREVLALGSMRRTLICLDSVEELPTQSAVGLLKGLSGIINALSVSHPSHQIRVFISSRHVSEFSEALSSSFSLRISPCHVQHDIENFVAGSIDQFAEEHPGFAAAVGSFKKHQITRKIVERANGMFLWANIALENFKRGLLWNRDIVDRKFRELDELQPGLNDLYANMISKVDSSIHDDMFAIFLVIATAERPLNQHELGILLAIQYSDRRISYSSEIQPFLDLENVIENNFPDLLSIDDGHNITFVHLSFKEYLYHHWDQMDSEWHFKARRKIAMSCMVYLNLRELVRCAKRERNMEGEILLYLYFINLPIGSPFADLSKESASTIVFRFSAMRPDSSFVTYIRYRPTMSIGCILLTWAVTTAYSIQTGESSIQHWIMPWKPNFMSVRYSTL